MSPEEPYDITSIPLFLWEPGLWLIPLCLGITCVILVLSRRRPRRRHNLRWGPIRRDLSGIIETGGEESAAIVSLSIRRYLAERWSKPLAAMTVRELQELKAHYPDPSEAAVLDHLISLETERWSAARVSSRDRLRELLRAVDRLDRRK